MLENWFDLRGDGYSEIKRRKPRGGGGKIRSIGLTDAHHCI